MSKRILSGISIRETQVRRWLDGKKFKGEYLLVSTKPELLYYKKLVSLPEETKLIVDLYTPLLLEKELAFSKWKPLDWLTRWKNKQMVKKFLQRGNHFLVANRRQREYWIETAGSLGVNLGRNDISVLPTGASRFQVSGFPGLASRPRLDPVEDGSARPRAGRFQTARRNVVLWFGGIYPWMDPRPVVEAFGKLAAKFPDWKLRFLGGWHPETGYKGVYKKLKEFSKQMISNNQLEFISWQSENNLGRYFKDVAFAVHLAKQTPEDYYSHRVRLLTLFSAGIPVLTSGRDVISDLAVKLGAAARTDSSGQDIEQDLICLISSPKQLNKMSKCCFKIEDALLKQETDLRLNDSNHLTLIK